MPSYTDLLQSNSTSALVVLAAMAGVAILEALVPLHRRSRWNRAHLGPNLTLTLVQVATNVIMSAALVLTLWWLESQRVGLFNVIAVPALMGAVASVIVLDFSTYAGHVA